MDMGSMGQMRDLFTKYSKLQEKLKTTIIRAREEGVLVDITGEMKIKDVKVEDESLLDISRKADLEDAMKKAFEKAQTKAQQVAMEQTKTILGFDPNDMLGAMGGGGMPKIPGLS